MTITFGTILCDSSIGALVHWYPGQVAPQGCYLEIDPRKKTLEADIMGDIGGGIPADVYHQLRIRFTIPILQGTTANHFMQSPIVQGLTQIIIDGFEAEWDGNNNVGAYNIHAQRAMEDLQRLTEDLVSDVEVWSARDYWRESEGLLKGLIEDGKFADVEALQNYLIEGAASEDVVLHEVSRFAEALWK